MIHKSGERAFCITTIVLSIVLACFLFINTDAYFTSKSWPKKYTSNRDIIIVLFERIAKQQKPTGVYSLQQCITPNDPLYQFLEKKKIIQAETKVIITAKDCITLQTRKQPKDNLLTLLSGSQYDFEDILITYNGNEGEMLCSVNSLYSLNQDEHNGLIRIVTTSLNGYINISKVRNY
jgi:hypothetical protein